MLARLVLALALVAGSLHSPALAHGDPAAHDAHDAIEVVALDADHHGAPTSHDAAGDTFHHHHCPAAVDVAGANMLPVAIAAEVLPAFARTAALSSRSQAPPTEPPSA
jgi:hypothetical protein